MRKGRCIERGSGFTLYRGEYSGLELYRNKKGVYTKGKLGGGCHINRNKGGGCIQWKIIGEKGVLTIKENRVGYTRGKGLGIQGEKKIGERVNKINKKG